MEGSLRGRLGVLATVELVAMDRRLCQYLRLVQKRRVVVKEELGRRIGNKGNAGKIPRHSRKRFEGDEDVD